VDLDFNYIGHAEREKMLEERPLIETALTELANKRKFRVQKSAEAFAGHPAILWKINNVKVHTAKSSREP
jgi:hypothetical protein